LFCSLAATRGCALSGNLLVKTPNYRQHKRQKELARKSRQSEKQQARQPRTAAEAVLAVDPAAAAKLKP
jgi:hypothetical protein